MPHKLIPKRFNLSARPHLVLACKSNFDDHPDGDIKGRPDE
jgi:hypothetical protein